VLEELWTRLYRVETLLDTARKVSNLKFDLLTNSLDRLNDRVQAIEDTLFAGKPINQKELERVQGRLGLFELILTPQFPNLFSNSKKTKKKGVCTTVRPKVKHEQPKKADKKKKLIICVVMSRNPLAVKTCKKKAVKVTVVPTPTTTDVPESDTASS
jgi:hypothetical protein